MHENIFMKYYCKIEGGIYEKMLEIHSKKPVFSAVKRIFWQKKQLDRNSGIW